MLEVKIYEVNTKEKWDKVTSELSENGFVFASDFSKRIPTFEEARKNVRGKLHIQTFYNDITKRNEISYCNKKTAFNDKVYGKKYKNVVFMG